MIDFEKILKTKGKSKADLARFLDIDPSNVNRTIKNDNITLSKIENICSFLDISLIDAMRISGYDDTPGVIPEATKKEKVSEYKDLLLSLSDQLVDLYHKKILAPYSVVEEKEEEIRMLNREIGKLENEIEKLKTISKFDREIKLAKDLPGYIHGNEIPPTGYINIGGEEYPIGSAPEPNDFGFSKPPISKKNYGTFSERHKRYGNTPSQKNRGTKDCNTPE